VIINKFKYNGQEKIEERIEGRKKWGGNQELGK